MTTTRRFEILSRSSSGLHFVREAKSRVMRMLTESELAEFDDPPPCPACAEQFGCEHLNYAGELLMTEAEIEAEVPSQWVAFAREHGISRADLERLRSIEQGDEGYRAAPGADLRTLELVVLLNEWH